MEGTHNRIIDFVCEDSNITRARYEELMRAVGQFAGDVGTRLNARSAVELGLIDTKGTTGDALKELKHMIQQARNARRSGEDHDVHSAAA